MRQSGVREISSKTLKFKVAGKKHAILVKGDKSQLDLFEAILQGNVQNAKAAIHNGANVNYRTDSGWSPLDFGVCQNNPDIITLLAENRAELTEYRGNPIYQPLIFAMRINNKEVAKTYLKHAPNIEKQTWFATIEDPDYLARIQELRAEKSIGQVLQTSLKKLQARIGSEGKNEEKIEEKSKSAELNRLLYRLKNYSVIFVRGILLPAAISIGLLSDRSYTNIAIATLFCAVTTVFTMFREPNLPFSLVDFSKGAELFCKDGLRDSITKIYNAPRYNPLAYIDYSYAFEGNSR